MADQSMPQLVSNIVFSVNAQNEVRISQEYIPIGDALPIQLQVLQWGLRPTTAGITILWNGKPIHVDSSHLAEIQNIQLDTLRIEDGLSERYVEFYFGGAIGTSGAFMKAMLKFAEGKYESIYVLVPAAHDDPKAHSGRRLFAVGLRRMAGERFYTLGKEKKTFDSLKEAIEFYNPIASQKPPKLQGIDGPRQSQAEKVENSNDAGN